MSTSNLTEDLMNKVLDILPDNILELLPIRDAARTSVLSKQWRCNWLSLKRLVFDDDFFYEDARGDWQECTNIISSILFLHNGPVHEFSFYIPGEANDKYMSLGPWLSFLSKNQVRWIKIQSDTPFIQISSHIFWCSELIHLVLLSLTLPPPPYGFSGFPELQHLELAYIEFSQEDIFQCLMAKCRKLATLMLLNCSGIGHIVIDVPRLEKLIITSILERESIAFKNVSNLKSIELRLESMPTMETIDAFHNLAYLHQLRYIKFDGDFLKFLAAANNKRLVPVTFNRLNKLGLHRLDLSSPGTLQNVFDMIESCPCMKELFISISSSNKAIHQKLDTTQIHKLLHLVKVKITGVAGADVELQLIEYLLAIAVVLEELFLKIYFCDTETELKLSRVLLEIPRASPKARLVCLR